MDNCSIVRLFGCLIAFGALAFSVIAEEPVQTRVSIASEPSGAIVVIDGAERGTTPLVVFDLKPGRHHLRCRLPGYVASDRFFDTQNGPYLDFMETLSEERGILLLKSDPAGCDIRVDGVSVGRTPRLLTNLPTKERHSICLRKEGYQDQLISVKFDGRRPLVREERMVLASGTLAITSDPAGAEVTINGVKRGVTPLEVSGVPKGRAVVQFHLDGFADETRELAVQAGDRQALPIVLTGLPGTLRLSSVPTGARLYVNGQAQGTAPQALSGLRPGTYEVRAELEGYAVMTKKVVIENGASANEEFRLSNVMGAFEVRTSPPGAQVLIDGRLAGVTKTGDPNAEFSDVLRVENLLEGEHSVVMKKDGFKTLTKTVKIRSKETRKWHRQRLSRLFLPDTEIVTANGTRRGVLLRSREDGIEIEEKPGVVSYFKRDDIRKINTIKHESSEQ